MLYYKIYLFRLIELFKKKFTISWPSSIIYKCKKAKIYIPTKTAMQSGLGKSNKWLLEFYTDDKVQNPLMGWQTSSNTLSEVKLEFL